MSGRAKTSAVKNEVSISVGVETGLVLSSSGVMSSRPVGDRLRTNNAAVTDSSHRSSRNSSRAIDSLSTLMMRWHSCGKKNSMSSYGNCRSLLQRT